MSALKKSYNYVYIYNNYNYIELFSVNIITEYTCTVLLYCAEMHTKQVTSVIITINYLLQNLPKNACIQGVCV